MSAKKTDIRDVTLIVVPDTHSGSDRAAMPPKIVLPPLMADMPHRTLYADERQLEIYNHIMTTADAIKASAKNKKKRSVIL